MELKHLRSTALAAGTAVLLACGGSGADPAPGPAPGPGPDPSPAPAPTPDEPTISISPHSGGHATDVQLRAAGFEPGERVGIGIGPPESEYEIFTHATAGSDGTVETTVNVPDWTEPGRDYLFVAAGEGPDEAISSRFRVTATDGGGEPGDGNGGVVRVTGVLTDEGVECQALRGEDGTLYTLAGETGRFDVGDRVEVTGTVAEMSICMQGTTLEVRDIGDAG